MTPSSIPRSLQAVEHWVCWAERQREQKTTKVPIDAQTGEFASVTDPETWASFDVAVQMATDTPSLDGIGFVFTEADSFVGVDLDNARDPTTGRPKSWAKDIITTLGSYTEISPSGTGYHVYAAGTLPSGRNRSGDVECYEHSRFFTVTGTHVEGTPPSIHERTDELRRVYTDYLATDDVEKSPTLRSRRSSSSLSDDDLLTRAKHAKNGAKFERLWRGDTSGYDSHSEADMALASLLAFWAGGDISRMDTLFRRSSLFREKWDERHYADGDTYGARTLKRAVELTDDFYDPSNTERRTTAEFDPEQLVVQLDEIDRRLHTLEAKAASIDTVKANLRTLQTEISRLQRDNTALCEQLDRERARCSRLNVRLDELETDAASSWYSRLFG